MRNLLLAVVVSSIPIAWVTGQTSPDAALQSQLERLFPEASSFSSKQGHPPHYKAFGPAVSGDEPELVGLAYWTTELEPLERAYDGPIKMLVGMDTTGVLRGIIVVDHREPYGYFSIDLPSFVAQFRQKSVRDPFRVGADIDAISRATITVSSASRAVRNSSRRIARALLTPPARE